MSDEKLRILEMIREGKVSAAEGLDLLQAIEQAGTGVTKAAAGERFLRVRVNGDKTKVNVNIPLALIKVASKFTTAGMNFVPEQARNEMAKKGIDFSQIDFDELINLIDQGLVDGKLVDVEVEDEKEGHMTVEVYVD
ncbi:MAG TPA: hypothetical protein VHQ70_08385 [Syntrophomonadaceae bacterium]|nr:hypothetical protein [Syntrophomonadaceae bacterium]